MNCREFTEFLDDYLSGNLPADELAEFESHLAECPTCIAYLDSYQRTIALEKAAFVGPEDAPLSAEAPEELVQAILRAGLEGLDSGKDPERQPGAVRRPEMSLAEDHVMLKPDRVPSSEITPPNVYFNRRTFLRAGVALASMAVTGTVYTRLNRAGSMAVATPALAELPVVAASPQDLARGFRVDERMTTLESVGNYNNFYEFTTNKEQVAAAAAKFVSRPWTVAVDGMVHKPKVFDLDEVLRLGPLEERVYRMRCVEGWSMVIPWAGLPLARLLDRVEPMGSARYVAFQTLLDPERMPGQRGSVLHWPYVEGLRMDEAMHPLTLLAAGLYGRELPAQNGAPLRLVVPWKYGFKGIKSIVKITLLSDQPPTTWNESAPTEYGFFSNVNPGVPHPRWSQATEQRIGEAGRRPTLLFNGYADQVGHLYAGMDLRANY